MLGIAGKNDARVYADRGVGAAGGGGEGVTGEERGPLTPLGLALGIVDTRDVPAMPWTLARCVEMPCALVHAVPQSGQAHRPRG